MKKLVFRILLGVFAFTLLYLTGAFIGASFDISQWNPDTREIVGCVGLLFSIDVMTFPHYGFDYENK